MPLDLLALMVLLTLAALMSSSAKHSAMDLMLRKAASRAPATYKHTIVIATNNTEKRYKHQQTNRPTHTHTHESTITHRMSWKDVRD